MNNKYSSSEQSESRSNSSRQARTIPELNDFAKHKNDKEMIKKLETLTEDVTKQIEEFRLHDAAQALYQFTWHEFADNYIEDVKNRIDENSYLILNTSYLILLQLLHPFMPFITEEIYQKLGSKGSIMITPWPSFTKVSEGKPKA